MVVGGPREKKGRGNPPLREQREEHVVGHKTRHRRDPPAGRAIENVAEDAKIGNAMCGDAQPAEPVEIIATGTTDEQPLLAFEQEAPDRVLLVAVSRPILFDHISGTGISHRQYPNSPYRLMNAGPAVQSP